MRPAASTPAPRPLPGPSQIPGPTPPPSLRSAPGGRRRPRAGPGQASGAAGVWEGTAARKPPAAPLLPAPRPPVVAVILEGREVLLELAVRLPQPSAQVLELAAERGLKGRVLGVHVAQPPGPRPRRSALCVAACAPSLLQAPGIGLPARWAGPRRRSRCWGGGEGARRKRTWCAQGAAASTRGAGQAPAPRRGPEWGRGPRPSASAPIRRRPGRSRRRGRKCNTRSSAAQDKNLSAALASGSAGKGRHWRWEHEGKWGLGAGLRALSCWGGQRLKPATAFSTADSSRGRLLASRAPLGLMQ